MVSSSRYEASGNQVTRGVGFSNEKKERRAEKKRIESDGSFLALAAFPGSC